MLAAPRTKSVRALLGLIVLALAAVVSVVLFSRTIEDARELTAPREARRQEASHRTEAPVVDVRGAPLALEDHSQATGQVDGSGNDPGPAPSPLDEARDVIAELVDRSLDGSIDVNRLVASLAAIADLPIETTADLDFEDNDAIPYRFVGTPEDTDAHFLVGLESFSRDGKEYRSFEIELQVGGNEVELHRGFLREGPRVRLQMDYDQDGNMGHLALIATRRVSLGDSRRAGIDAYQGEFTNGISYATSLTDPADHSSETIGVRDGRSVTSLSDPPFGEGIRPLVGDVEIDPEVARLLFDRMRARLASLQATSRR